VYDEKIKTAKDNIDANRKALKQMDEAVDQVMGRSTTETGADKAVAIRRGQQKERSRLQSEIAAEQKTITQLNEERAPIAAEVRKVEAEVGPIKYIAAMVYGENTDANSLEAAVRWVIILLVIVFDPLAIMMLLAATESLKWEKQRLFDLLKLPEPNPDPEPNLQAVNHMLAAAAVIPEPVEPVVDTPKEPIKFVDPGEHPRDYDETAVPDPVPEKSLLEQHPYLTTGFDHFKNLKPMVYKPLVVQVPVDEDIEDGTLAEKAAQREWKKQNPGSTIKSQRTLLDQGRIDQLPWLGLIADNSVGFGNEFPFQPIKGNMWVKTESVPTRLFKFNGKSWIEIDKATTDSYTYNTDYINYLIDKISSGEYDTELLSDAERDQIALEIESKKAQ
jgi:hypothetical protein